MMAALAFVLAYALADRFAGGGAPALDAKLPGRAAFWGALLCAGVGYLFAEWPGVALAVGWLAYRTPKWALFKGASTTPNKPSEYVATLWRHLIVLIPAFIIAKAFGLDALLFCIPFAAYAVAATGLAAWYGAANAKAVREGRGIASENAFVELARGGAFGLAVAVGLFIFGA